MQQEYVNVIFLPNYFNIYIFKYNTYFERMKDYDK